MISVLHSWGFFIFGRGVSFLQLAAWLSIVGTSMSREYLQLCKNCMGESSQGIIPIQDDVLAKFDGIGGNELLYHRPNSRIMWNSRVPDVRLGRSIMLRLFTLLRVLWFHHVHPTLCFGSHWPCMIFGNWIKSWFICLNLNNKKTPQCVLSSHMNLWIFIDPWFIVVW